MWYYQLHVRFAIYSLSRFTFSGESKTRSSRNKDGWALSNCCRQLWYKFISASTCGEWGCVPRCPVCWCHSQGGTVKSRQLFFKGLQCYVQSGIQRVFCKAVWGICKLKCSTYLSMCRRVDAVSLTINLLKTKRKLH